MQMLAPPITQPLAHCRSDSRYWSPFDVARVVTSKLRWKRNHFNVITSKCQLDRHHCVGQVFLSLPNHRPWRWWPLTICCKFTATAGRLDFLRGHGKGLTNSNVIANVCKYTIFPNPQKYPTVVHPKNSHLKVVTLKIIITGETAKLEGGIPTLCISPPTCRHVLCSFLVDTSQNAVLLSHILDILSLCVERHTYHIRNYIIEKNVLARVLVLMTSSHGHLVLGESIFPCIFASVCV